MCFDSLSQLGGYQPTAAATGRSISMRMRDPLGANFERAKRKMIYGI